MKVALLGDMHGSESWINRAIDQFASLGLTTIIQVGDLSVWPGKQVADMWDRVNAKLTRFTMTMLVAPGNHEDYGQLQALTPRDDGWLPFRDRILLAPRGHRTTLGGRSFVWLGGAASLDRIPRQRADAAHNADRAHWGSSKRVTTWWEQEAITHADVDTTVAGGTANIMVCHDAPGGVQAIRMTIRGNPEGFDRRDLAYAREVRTRLDRAVRQVKPALLLHGHYHFAVNENVNFGDFTTHVFGLANDGQPCSTGVLDLDSLEPTFVDRPRSKSRPERTRRSDPWPTPTWHRLVQQTQTKPRYVAVYWRELTARLGRCFAIRTPCAWLPTPTEDVAEALALSNDDPKRVDPAPFESKSV